jgi:hypothetical protein
MRETEEQRTGRNKETAINHSYIAGGEYRKKFDSITEDAELIRLLYRISKDMLLHRTGTLFEDMYWIDLDSMSVVAKEVNSSIPKKIVYSDTTPKIISGYNEDEAQIAALLKIQQNFDIDFKEVTADGSI